MRAVAGLGRGATRLTRGAIGGAVTATPILAGAGLGMARFGLQLGAAGLHGMSSASHLLRTLPNNLVGTRPASRRGGITPPQYQGQAGPGRKVLQPSPRRGPGGGEGGGWPELPPGPSAIRGRTLTLEPSGIGQETVDGRRVYVAAATPSPQRTFAPTDQGQRARAAGRMDETFGVSGPLATGREALADRAPHRPVGRSRGAAAPTVDRSSSTTARPAQLVAPPIRPPSPPPAPRVPTVDTYRPTRTVPPVPTSQGLDNLPPTRASTPTEAPVRPRAESRPAASRTAAAPKPPVARTPANRVPPSLYAPGQPRTNKQTPDNPAAVPQPRQARMQATPPTPLQRNPPPAPRHPRRIPNPPPDERGPPRRDRPKDQQ